MGAFFQSGASSMNAPSWAMIIPIAFFVIMIILMKKK